MKVNSPLLSRPPSTIEPVSRSLGNSYKLNKSRDGPSTISTTSFSKRSSLHWLQTARHQRQHRWPWECGPRISSISPSHRQIPSVDLPYSHRRVRTMIEGRTSRLIRLPSFSSLSANSRRFGRVTGPLSLTFIRIGVDKCILSAKGSRAPVEVGDTAVQATRCCNAGYPRPYR